jgi:ribonuclease PH
MYQIAAVLTFLRMCELCVTCCYAICNAHNSVCGGCMAMMDAGVPITSPIAGVAMGLLLDEVRNIDITLT